jgi:type II secretory pathway pseudopilin PulG
MRILSHAEPRDSNTMARVLRSNEKAFTMVEIALCLAIIAFALVAIIGVLPTGMNVQKENREETIINQDAAVWMDAIRTGAKGYNDLTNYVISITNFWTTFTETPTTTNRNRSGADWYINNDSSTVSGLGLTTGYRIIGLLSMPKRIEPQTGHPLPHGPGNVQSNYIVAYVRAMSGSVVEKYPQRTFEILESAFQYRMIIENTPYVPFDPATIDLSAAATNGMNAAQLQARIERERIMMNLRQNSRDIRLLFRWPVLPTGTGNLRQTFRQLVGGRLVPATDLAPLSPTNTDLYFFQPSTYAAVPP